MSSRVRRLCVFAGAIVGLLIANQPSAVTANYQYRYDSAGRLIEVRSESLITYQYDAAGTIVNRQSGPNPVLFADGFEEVP